MPNNRIFWGQAAVTNTKGFGAAAANNSNGFGSVHARTYGHDETNLVGYRAIFNDYIADVIAAGGEVDSRSCLRASFQEFANIQLPLLAEAQAYKADVITAGGEVDSLFCVRDTFLNLD